MEDYAQRLQAKISPENVTVELVRAGCFLTAYELIKKQVVDAVHDFFWCGFEDGNNLYDEATYQRDVRSRAPKSKYRASCLWLIEMQALTVEQVATLERIHAHRQEIAHELPKLLVDPDFSVDVQLLADAIECVRALGVFWGSIEVQTSPDFDGVDVAPQDIKSGSYLLMEYLGAIAGVERYTPSQVEADWR